MSTPSLSINPPLSPPPPLFSPSPTPSPTPSSYTPTSTSHTSLSPLRSHQPTYPLPTKSQFLHPKRSNYYNNLTRRSFAVANNMTITSNMSTTDLRLQERDHLLLDSEMNSARPRRIALFVEPSPFAWASLITSGLLFAPNNCDPFDFLALFGGFELGFCYVLYVFDALTLRVNSSRPRRIALFVEPSPFAWVFLIFFWLVIDSK